MKVEYNEWMASVINFKNEYDSVLKFRTKKLLLAFIEYLYIEKNLTVREICQLAGIEYTYEIQKIFNKIWRKTKHGGARKGAGNKPGITFCKSCRKSIKNCNCSPYKMN